MSSVLVQCAPRFGYLALGVRRCSRSSHVCWQYAIAHGSACCCCVILHLLTRPHRGPLLCMLLCLQIVNRCAAHAYDVMFAVPAIDGKFRTDGWLRVPANGELTTCWTTQAGMAERRVAMHVEAAGPAKVDSVLKPTFPVRQTCVQTCTRHPHRAATV